MNLTESKFYVFSMKGLLRNRIDFSKAVKKHGLPVAVSENGLNFVLYHKSNNSKQGRPECSIYYLQEHEFTWVKTIELDKCFREYIDRLKKSLKKNRKTFGRQLEMMLEINPWINPIHDERKETANKKTKNVEHSFEINNKMDIIIKFSKIDPKHAYKHLVTSEPNVLLNSIINKDNDEDSIFPSDNMFQSINRVGSSLMGSKDNTLSSPSPKKKMVANKMVKIHPDDGAGNSVSKDLGQSVYELSDKSEKEKKNYLKYESVYYFQSGGYQIP